MSGMGNISGNVWMLEEQHPPQSSQQEKHLPSSLIIWASPKESRAKEYDQNLLLRYTRACLWQDEQCVCIRLRSWLMRLTDTLDLYRDQMSTIMDANLSIASNELNKVMRTLTATSIILMFNSLVAGIYGMNFENMPELHWQYGYFGVLVLMVVVSMLLVLFFKRLKWF